MARLSTGQDRYEIWTGLVGSQTAEEFWAESQAQGATTYREAAEAYIEHLRETQGLVSEAGWTEEEVPVLIDMLVEVMEEELGEEGDDRKMMDELEFAEALGFNTVEDLMNASEVIIREGDIYWVITALPDGRWAAWDDAELSLDRVEYFATREEAIEFHRDAYGYTLVLDDFLTERGGREAVCLPWEEVENLLGGYDDTEEDDNQLIAALRKMTAAKGWPKWIDDPDTRRIVTDDSGWWLVGPRVEEA